MNKRIVLLLYDYVVHILTAQCKGLDIHAVDHVCTILFSLLCYSILNIAQMYIRLTGVHAYNSKTGSCCRRSGYYRQS